MSGVDLKERVHSFCQALTIRNIENLRSLFADQAILSWGPYKFVGIESILSWASELWELFPFISFKEKSIEDNESTAKHEFMIAFITQEGRKGWLPCESVYRFDGDRITQLDVKLLHGFVAVSRDDVERVKPHPIK
jgi:hypothetical protein